MSQLTNTFEYSRLSAELLNKYRSFGTTRDAAHDILIDDILNNPAMKENEVQEQLTCRRDVTSGLRSSQAISGQITKGSYLNWKKGWKL